MDVLLLAALFGLFLFLALRHQQSKFSRQTQSFIDEMAAIQYSLEQRIESMSTKVIEYDKVAAELEFARQMTQNTVPLDYIGQN